MTDLADLLDTYVAHHRELGGPFEKAPPVSDSERTDVEASLGLAIPDSVLELWRWSNGCAPTSDTGVDIAPLFLNNMHFWSLSESARNVAEQRRPGIFAEELLEDQMIRAAIVPVPGLLIADAYETLQAVVSLREEDAGSVWLWMSYGLGCRRCFDSIEDFVRLQISFYEAGMVEAKPPHAKSTNRYPTPVVSRFNPQLTSMDIPLPWYATWYGGDPWFDESWTVP